MDKKKKIPDVTSSMYLRRSGVISRAEMILFMVNVRKTKRTEIK